EDAPTAEYVDSSGDEVSGAKAGLNASATEIADDSSSDGYGDPGAGADDDQGGSDDGGGGGGHSDDGGEDRGGAGRRGGGGGVEGGDEGVQPWVCSTARRQRG